MWLAGIALCGQVQQMMALVRGSCGAAGETDLAHEALAKPLAAADGATMSAAVADGDGPMADEPAVAHVQPSLCAAVAAPAAAELNRIAASALRARLRGDSSTAEGIEAPATLSQQPNAAATGMQQPNAAAASGSIGEDRTSKREVRVHFLGTGCAKPSEGSKKCQKKRSLAMASVGFGLMGLSVAVCCWAASVGSCRCGLVTFLLLDEFWSWDSNRTQLVERISYCSILVIITYELYE